MNKTELYNKTCKIKKENERMNLIKFRGMPVITGEIQGGSIDVLMYFNGRSLDFGKISMINLIKKMFMKNLNFFKMVMVECLSGMVGQEQCMVTVVVPE